jgi:hypothetical protein
MFRNTRVAEEAAASDAAAEPQAAEPVPLSVLALDLVDVPSGWTVWLAERGIAVVFDDIGRPSVAREDARKLLEQQRQAEIRRQDHAHRQEAAAVEKDRAFRASLPKGIHWSDIPPGMTMGEYLAANDPDRQRGRRRTPLQDALSNDGMTFYSLHEPAEEAS